MFQRSGNSKRVELINRAPDGAQREESESGIFSKIQYVKVPKNVLLQIWGYKKRSEPIISAPESAHRKESESGMFSKKSSNGDPENWF